MIVSQYSGRPEIEQRIVLTQRMEKNMPRYVKDGRYITELRSFLASVLPLSPLYGPSTHNRLDGELLSPFVLVRLLPTL